MAKPFTKMRGLTDKVLNQALANHAQALQWVVGRIASYDKWRWVRRVWAVGITAGVLWLLVQ